MKALLPILRLVLTAAPWAMARGAALSIVVLLMGAALLGLSGWFITATGLAGIAGIGIAFDVFRPSAGVRFLALGRTAARYGERVLTHDATLRALAALRTTLLRRQGRLDGRALARLRGEAELTRIASDVDALDGVALRLLLPGGAALVTHLAVFLALGWLAGWPVAWVVLGGYVPVAAIIFWFLARRSIAPSDQSEVQAQALRRGVIDMIRDRQSLILRARLEDRETALMAFDAESRKAARSLDGAERAAAAALSSLVGAVTGAALVVGGGLVASGAVGPAAGAIGVFVALALAETLAPLARGVAEYGRMVGAARRIGGDTLGDAEGVGLSEPKVPAAAVLALRVPGLSLDLRLGEAAAITGPSGSGKTSLLLRIAGLADSDGIAILGVRPADWSESALRQMVSMVPQRSALIAGTIRENLALASDASDADMWKALDAVCLSGVMNEREGLDTRLGEAGAGLSGGQARRLTLARGILRRPRLLLLDEPTEGLDEDTALRVLSGIRAALPDAAILATLHRSADHPIFDVSQTLNLSRCRHPTRA
jgi:ATP-binding cassette subfamily C protein CydC